MTLNNNPSIKDPCQAGDDKNEPQAAAKPHNIPAGTVLDPIRAAEELREQLAIHSRRVGFLLGSGTSIASGLPGIDGLTAALPQALDEQEKRSLELVSSELRKGATAEDMLNRVRLYRELLTDNQRDAVNGLTLKNAEELDHGICRSIVETLHVDPPAGLHRHVAFAQWVGRIRRSAPVELFTLNYDLLLERGFEFAAVPFFDGFVGNVEPFFVEEAVDAEARQDETGACPPRSWARIWKLHGSIGWRKRQVGGRDRIVRASSRMLKPEDELVIYPAREKYAESRRLPFVVLLDRLRHFISTGEVLLIVIGYAWQDEHINEVLLQGLQSNSRLAITSLFFDAAPDRVIQMGVSHPEFTILASEAGCIGGQLGAWADVSGNPKEGLVEQVWDQTRGCFELGDFSRFAAWLCVTSGIPLPDEEQVV